jgi:hypothetical protein
MHSVWYVVFTVLTLLFLGIAIGIFILKQPIIDSCQGVSNIWVRPQCVYIQEKYLDTTIPIPKQNLYLGDFTYDPNLPGGPLCEPMYYAFRYVRTSDGGYSPLSPWTTIPIYSGASTFPCYPQGSNPTSNPPDGWCSLDGIETGSQSCQFNRPTIVTVDPLDLAIADGYILNLHRQIGTFDPTSTGELVGNLLAVSRNNPNAQGWTSSWPDVLFNPNSQGTRCRGC